MKRFIKCICVILSLATLASIPVSAAQVDEPPVGTNSLYFISCSAYIWQESGTRLNLGFDVTAKRIMQELGAATIEVQRSPDARHWSPVATYESGDYPEMLCENTSMHMSCVYYSGTYGYYYRTRVTVYAKDSGGSSYYTVYSEPYEL